MHAYRATRAFDGMHALRHGTPGHLAVGLDADLLAVAGDLLADVTALRQVRAVVLRGRAVAAGGTVSDIRS